MSLLIPETLSAASQRKYFKRVIHDELNVLVRTGLAGPDGNIKVKVFAQVGFTPPTYMSCNSPTTQFHPHAHSIAKSFWINDL